MSNTENNANVVATSTTEELTTEQLLNEAIRMQQTTRPFRAYIVTVGSLKGGVGKTTITVQLAGFLVQRGYRVMIVDGDIQSTATKWVGESAASETSPLSKVSVANLAKLEGRLASEVRKYVNDYDFILVDCPPKLGQLMHSALSISDLMLIPTRPSVPDIDSAKETLDLANHVTGNNPNLKIAFVVTHRRPNTILSNTSNDMIKSILSNFTDPNPEGVQLVNVDEKYAHQQAEGLAESMQGLNVVFMKSSTQFRECYPQSYVCGDVVTYFKNQEAAIAEMASITNEALMILTDTWAEDEEDTAESSGEAPAVDTSVEHA